LIGGHSVVISSPKRQKGSSQHASAQVDVGIEVGGTFATPVAMVERVDLHTRLHSLRLLRISTRNEAFLTRICIETEWAAPDSEDVRNLANGADQMDVDWVPEWIPTFSFVNEISCTVNKSTFFTNMVDGKYNVHRDLKLTADIGERLDLEEFPFDIQDPTLLFELTQPSTPWILIGVGAFAPNQMESGVVGDYFRSKNGSIGWVYAWAKSLGAVGLAPWGPLGPRGGGRCA
jgi:hypothetical protein